MAREEEEEEAEEAEEEEETVSSGAPGRGATRGFRGHGPRHAEGFRGVLRVHGVPLAGLVAARGGDARPDDDALVRRVAGRDAVREDAVYRRGGGVGEDRRQKKEDYGERQHGRGRGADRRRPVARAASSSRMEQKASPPVVNNDDDSSLARRLRDGEPVAA